jgi:hypothetical protein
MYPEEIAAKSRAISKVRGYFPTLTKPTQSRASSLPEDNSRNGRFSARSEPLIQKPNLEAARFWTDLARAIFVMQHHRREAILGTGHFQAPCNPKR